ncbi:telomeric repeat binding factor a [Siniperca chuatsi]|uniref:telomeric repeat binding factor a n=1 Tax=Siniperca chuatsi TaxID=119488 RepID=UPI001CE13962|nr:telomeric repeat binding factor a [Siniperca chuatsi]
MAASETVNSHLNDFEPVVNRWLVDYYFFLALELFEKEQYADFCDITNVLERVLARPMEGTDTSPTKILVLQFLCRIHAGESPDMSFESDGSISPLESALVLLEKNYQKFNIPPQDFKNVCTSLKEMIVGIFIKNNEFDKAEEVLNKHCPKPVVGKKAIFMGLIRQKSNTHEVIEQINFKWFKEEMLAFCQRLLPFSVPFLHKAAKRLADERLAKPDNKAAGPDEQDEPGPSSSARRNSVQFAPFKHKTIEMTRLEVTYRALAAGSDERTFAQLEEEEQARRKDFSLCLSPTPKKGTKRDSAQDGLFQRDSGSPMEASPADQPQTHAVPQTQAGSLSKTPSVLRNRRLYTVARLVVEPDSQGSSQCTTASQELEVEVRTEEPLQSPTIHNNKDLQNPVADHEFTILTWKHPRRANKIYSSASTSLAELSADNEEEPPCSVANGETCVGKLHNQSNISLSRNSTKSKQSSSDSEEEDQQESPASCKTPVRKPREQLASDPLSKDPDNTGDMCIRDSSLDSSPEQFPLRPVPQTSSTPHKGSAQDKGPFHSKWKWLYNNAKESKDTWSDEESFFTSRKKSGSPNESTISNSGHRKRKWTESETEKLREGVKKFGEGNWSKIKAYYSFKDRTNVNLKDRWRTMKNSKMV